MELEVKELLEPVSPSGQYLKSSSLSLCIIAVLEMEIPIDDSQAITMLKNVFLPINTRFSSIMIQDKKGVKKWKRVEVKLENHVVTPSFPDGQSLEFYDKCFSEYLSSISMEELPHNQPLWEIHIVKYPTSNAAGNLVFKLHHSLGDGYSLMGALLSCLQRADDPSLPLTLPSRQSSSRPKNSGGGGNSSNGKINLKRVPRFFSAVGNTVLDFGCSLLKSSILQDDVTPIRNGDEGVEFRSVSFTTLSLSLDQLKKIKDKLNLTINDVITGIIMHGTRAYMGEVRPESRTSNSTALVLLNTRAIDGYKSVANMVKPKAKMPWGNHFAFLHVPLPKLNPADSSNPLTFLLKAKKTIGRLRNSLAVYLTGWLLELVRKFRGPEATAKYVRSTIKNASMAISNMIGPLERMSISNHPVRGLYFSVTCAPMNLVIGIVSYVGELRIAITGEKGFIDTEKLKQCIEHSFETMFKAAMQIP